MVLAARLELATFPLQGDCSRPTELRQHRRRLTPPLLLFALKLLFCRLLNFRLGFLFHGRERLTVIARQRPIVFLLCPFLIRFRPFLPTIHNCIWAGMNNCHAQGWLSLDRTIAGIHHYSSQKDFHSGLFSRVFFSSSGSVFCAASSITVV